MRIGTVLSGLTGKARRGGLARYAHCLLSALAQVDRRNTYVLFLHPDNAQDFAHLPASWRRVVLPLPRPEARYLEQIVLPPLLYGLRLDVVHYPVLAPALAYAGPSVVTVHDLTNQLFPRRANLRSCFYSQHVLRVGATRATSVIAVSRNTRDDVVRLWGLAPERVEVIYEAASPAFDGGLAEPTSAEDAYFLAVGTMEPIKNFARLLEAYGAARGRLPEDVTLMVVGQPGWQCDGLLRSTQELGLDGSVRFIGYVSDADLADLYSGALAFVYPSLYEGFGLPPLEAMTCGAPVIASRTSSLPEVVGEAGLLVDPLDIEDMAAAMVRVASDPALREEMRRAGRARARQFSWRECAGRTLTVLEKAATQGKGTGAFRGSRP
jgi:glycosyltransferase involved in cell wall biosynthesis